MFYKTTLLWFRYILRNTFGRKRFLGLSLPFNTRQFIYDRITGPITLTIRGIDDWIQIEHIFLNEEYCLSGTGREEQINQLHRAIRDSGAQPLIIDLGANIGLASKYFDLVYPSCHIVAVEPDIGNCNVATRNLPRSSILRQAAISSKQGSCRLVETGRNVGYRSEPSTDGNIKFVTVPELLDSCPGCAPFLIKIDIEGFEIDLFDKNVDWIDRFPVILIELHDWMLPGKGVSAPFLREMALRNRDFMHFDGYIASIARDLSEFRVL